MIDAHASPASSLVRHTSSDLADETLVVTYDKTTVGQTEWATADHTPSQRSSDGDGTTLFHRHVKWIRQPLEP